MSQPIYATDVDSVLLDITTPMVAHFARKYPKGELYTQGVNHWDIGLSYGVPQADVDEMWGYLFAKPTPEEPGAREFVEDLKAKGYRVVAVTARIPQYQDRLLKDVAAFGLDDIIFARDKEETLTKLGPLAFIDDKVQHTQEAHRAGVPNIFLFDQPWNFSFDLNTPHYKRVFFHEEAIV